MWLLDDVKLHMRHVFRFYRTALFCNTSSIVAADVIENSAWQVVGTRHVRRLWHKSMRPLSRAVTGLLLPDRPALSPRSGA